MLFWGVRWRSGRTSDYESRGPGFNLHRRHHIVSLSKAHLLPRVLVNTQEVNWLHSDMTEKLLKGTLNLKTNIQYYLSSENKGAHHENMSVK